MARKDLEPKACIAYVRVSTRQQGRSGLGVEAQQEAISQFCERERFKIIEGPTTSEFAEVANCVALFEGPLPVMTAAEVARQGYAALKAGRPQIITGLTNRILAISTRFMPTAILLKIAGHLNCPGSDGSNI